MQIDCAAVPAPARLDLLPDRGVLYFFLDLNWAQPDAVRVLYQEGPDAEWGPIQPPDDLDYVFGDQATYTWKWTQSAQDCPKQLPKWPFQPVAIDVPPDAHDPEREADAPVLWPGDKVMAEALRAAQGESVLATPFSITDFIDADSMMRRPFANYPHDWRAMQICCRLLLDRVRENRRLPSSKTLRALSDIERDAFATQLRGEARSWFDRAAAQHAFAAVPPADSDEFWSWVAGHAALAPFVMAGR